jgi:hypothetical protein
MFEREVFAFRPPHPRGVLIRMRFGVDRLIFLARNSGFRQVLKSLTQAGLWVHFVMFFSIPSLRSGQAVAIGLGSLARFVFMVVSAGCSANYLSVL